MLLIHCAGAGEAHAFSYVQVDGSGPAYAWGKAVGDIDGDGRKDLVVGGYRSRNGGLYWYQNPGWRKRTISATAQVGTGLQVADIDRDGRRDVVAVGRAGGRFSLTWFEQLGSGAWRPHLVESGRELDQLAVGDLDGDGRLDLVARNYGATGNRLHVWRQVTPTRWAYRQLALPQGGEGLRLADLDRDRRPDVIVNDDWLENRSRPGAVVFVRHRYNAAAPRNAYLATGDLNGDGRVDIVATPAERAGQYYRVSWYEAPARPTGPWREHVLETNVECVVHSAIVGDFDRDGRPDVVTAMMAQGRNPRIKLYRNRGGGRFSPAAVIARASSHAMQAIDINNNGRLSLFGADWRGAPRTRIELWRQ